MFRPGLRAGLRLRPPGIVRPRLYSVKPPNAPLDPPSSTPKPPSAGPQPALDPKTEAKLEKKLGRLERYAPALAALSARTGVSLPALTGAFLVLHEVTAVVPVFLVYWVLHALGVGAGLVAWLADVDAEASNAPSKTPSGFSGGVPVDHESATRQREGEGVESAGTPGWKNVVHGWYEEGARKVERVGRRYGWLGYERGSKAGDAPDAHAEQIVTRDAGAVADAVAAYVVVKVSFFLPCWCWLSRPSPSSSRSPDLALRARPTS